MLKTKPLPILLYHHIGTGSNATSPEIFGEHMAYLHRRGIKAISLADFETALTNATLPSGPSVLITFDDSSRSCLTEALPILSEYSFFATAFLISGRMKVAEGVLNPYGDALTWGEARVLRDSGHFSLQSHSHSHSRWPLDTNGQQQVAAELALSHQALVNELGSTQGHFHHLAWPWGRCNAAFEKTALDLGFTYQYLVQKGAVTHAGTKLRLPRLCCDGMPTVTFSRWIDLLTKPYPALAVNCVYGSIRQWRHGLAYH